MDTGKTYLLQEIVFFIFRKFMLAQSDKLRYTLFHKQILLFSNFLLPALAGV